MEESKRRANDTSNPTSDHLVDPHNMIAPRDEATDRAWITDDVPIPAQPVSIGLPKGVVPQIKEAGSATFAVLAHGWETYMGDKKQASLHTNETTHAPTCGGSDKGQSDPQILVSDTRLSSGRTLAPLPLRHTFSTPIQSRSSSIFDPDVQHHQTEVPLPKPAPLEPLQRSTSTPSAFRQRSVGSTFGSAHVSAFTLPPQTNTKTSSYDSTGLHSAFDPVQYYVRALEHMEEDEQMEETAIEVVPDLSKQSLESVDNGQPTKTRRGAAFRAARFLSDVGSLRRRRRLGGRENPAEPASVLSCESPDSNHLRTSVTVVTGKNKDSSTELESVEDEVAKAKAVPSSLNEGYERLDSDIDEEEDNCQKIETQLQAESPGPVSSPSYQRLVDSPSRVERHVNGSQRIKIQISTESRTPGRIVLPSAATPSPLGIENGEIRHSHADIEFVPGSPTTARSSVTGSSSGHTTTATSTVSNSQISGLSTISETDREVMEANKEAKRQRSLEQASPLVKSDTGGPSVNSSSTTSTNTQSYFTMTNSPAPLRDGANVPPARFFMDSPSGSTANNVAPRVRSNNSSSSRMSSSTLSPGNADSVTNTSSSGSSREEPPQIVSYLEPGTADQTSLRESNGEEREGSPAEIIESQVTFAQAVVVPRRHRRGPLDRFRSRPPRSPAPARRSPPPIRGCSPFHHVSPPRHIVDRPPASVRRIQVANSAKQSLPQLSDLGVPSIGNLGMLVANLGVGAEEMIWGQNPSWPFSDGSVGVRKGEHT